MQVVRIDQKGRALDKVVSVSKGGHDNVLWVALGNGGPWKITFDKATGGIGFQPGSPFSENEYIVARGWFVSTMNGPVASVVINGTYSYSVRNVTTNVLTDDPDVDIDP